MGVKTLRLSELSGLSDKEIEARVAEFTSDDGVSLSDVLDDLNRRISVFEMRYEMSSEIMLERLVSGVQNETGDICAWMQLCEIRSGLVQKRGRNG